MKIKISGLDKKFSQWVRSRAGWKCERCFTQYTPPTNGLHNSHFWGRAKKSTRFDPDNCAALCHGCHSHFTANPELHRAWFLKRLGEDKYNTLMLRANKPFKPDYEMINLFLTKELKSSD